METREFSIFRIPDILLNGHKNDFHPEALSIGPFHHGSDDVKEMERRKHDYFQSLIDRYFEGQTEEQKQLLLSEIWTETGSMVLNAKKHYSGDFELDDSSFSKMLVSDCCFIMYLFSRILEMTRDPSFISSRTLKHFIKRDLVKLENQIPLFLLNNHFYIVNPAQNVTSLQALVLDYFKNEVKWMRNFSVQSSQSFSNLEGKHLLDLLRLTFDVSAPNQPSVENPSADFIECATKLWDAGIIFKSGVVDGCFLNINFKIELKFIKGVLKIPKIVIDSFTACFIRNCIAFEHFHDVSSKHFIAYAIFMRSLIRSEKDLQLLIDNGIIVNRYGRVEDLVKYFIELDKDMNVNMRNLYLSRQLEEVNSFYDNSFYMWWSRFKNDYSCYFFPFVPLFCALLVWILKSIVGHYLSLSLKK